MRRIAYFKNRLSLPMHALFSRLRTSPQKFGLWLILLFVLAFMVAPVMAHPEHREDKLPGEQIEADVMAMSNSMPAASHQLSERDATQAEGDNRFDTVDFLGRLHPAAAHFPIALILTAAFAELLLWIRPGLGLATTVRFMIYVGAAGAVGTAFLGWFAGGFRLTDRDPTLGFHRWNGTAIAAVALLAAAVAARAQVRRTGLRMLLGLLSIAIVLQGFLGGELSFGPNHLGI